MRLCHLEQSSPTFVASGIGLMEDHFSMDPGGGGFQEDSSTLLLLRTLFLLHQLHIRSSGIRYQRLGTPALKNGLGVGRTFDEEETAHTEAQR